MVLFTENNKLVDTKPYTAPKLLGSYRLSLCTMVGVALALLYLLRINLSLTMVCMVHKGSINRTSPYVQQSNASTDWSNRIVNETWYEVSELGDTYENAQLLANYQGEFEWTRKFEGYVLSSYFYGYISTMIPSGFLAGRFGGKHVLGTGLLISSIATMLIPPAVRFNEHLLIVLRVIIGAASGVFPPATMNLVGVWYAEYERTFLMSLSLSGVSIGIVAAYLLSSLFCTISFDNGWPINFYFTGGVGLVFWMFWNRFVFSSPAQHPLISAEERFYIDKSSVAVTSNKPKQFQITLVSKILTSRAVWAICIADFTTQWFVNMSLVTLPLYMADVHRFDIQQNGIFLLLPQLLTVATGVIIGKLSDRLNETHLFRTSTIRKILQSIASFGSSLLLIVLANTEYDQRHLAVVLLIIVTPILNIHRAGYGVNVLDIAPRFSGEIFSITNALGETSGIWCAIAVGYLTTNGTQEEWRSTFYISAALLVFGGIFFLVFAEGTLQSWAAEPKIEECDSGVHFSSALNETSCNGNRLTTNDDTSDRRCSNSR